MGCVSVEQRAQPDLGFNPLPVYSVFIPSVELCFPSLPPQGVFSSPCIISVGLSSASARLPQPLENPDTKTTSSIPVCASATLFCGVYN